MAILGLEDSPREARRDRDGEVHCSFLIDARCLKKAYVCEWYTRLGAAPMCFTSAIEIAVHSALLSLQIHIALDDRRKMHFAAMW